jgi:hypothetical protein
MGNLAPFDGPGDSEKVRQKIMLLALAFAGSLRQHSAADQASQDCPTC